MNDLRCIFLESPFWVGSSPYNPVDLRPSKRTGTHGTRFKRNVKCTSGKVFASKPTGCRSDGQHLGMSRATFARFFRRIAGESFVTYLNHWRIQRAAMLLRETQRPVLDIAQHAGYQNLSYFNRKFIRIMGVKPTTYRSLSTS